VKTILLCSNDSDLAGRIAATLARGEEILLVSPEPSAFALPGPTHGVLVLLDCRATTRHETEQAIVRVRGLNTESFRCVALVGGAPPRRIEVIGSDSIRDYDVILAEHDDVGITLRAILNDVDWSIGVAVALDGLRGVLEPAALRIAGAVLASGCRVDGVERAATALHTDRSALGDEMADEGLLVPKNIVSIARATYAAVLVRRTHLTLGNIATRVNVSAGRYVQEMLEREFHADADALRERERDMPIEDLLDLILTEWSWRNRGGGGAS
jgi:hypothetical protein